MNAPTPSTSPSNQLARSRQVVWVAAAGLSAVAAAAAARGGHIGLFPRAAWLNHPWPVLGLAAGGAGAGYLWARHWSGRLGPWRAGLILLPLALNLLTLFNPVVPLPQAVGVWGASLWLASALWLAWAYPRARDRWWVAWLWLCMGLVYGLTMSRTVGSADTFEFQVVAPRLGIVHPTGYPLYLLLGKAWTLLPWGAVAWRLNLGTLVYALLALAVVFRLARRLSGNPLAGLLAALALGLRPTFWSQAIEAEVYSLHLLLVAVAFWLMLTLLENRTRPGWVGLAAVLGLGLTHHLTSVLLWPAAGLTLWWGWRRGHLRLSVGRLGGLILAFLAPLSLYLYLPWRWQVVNGEPMGWARFLDWVVGGRFQGAWQWRAWLEDGARYAIVGRLFSAEWPPLLLALAAVGAWLLLKRHTRAGLLLGVTWLAYVFYGLNYHVPDLNVFLLPTQLIMALWLGCAAAMLLPPPDRSAMTPALARRQALTDLVCAGLAALVIWQALALWPQRDRSGPNAWLAWGQGVLALPIPTGAAILADSEKIAPLYYLQQAEGVRPDLDILVLPDEAAYRAELEARLAAGQPVYLARYLPRLPYYLRALGPLTEVSLEPLNHPPENLPSTSVQIGPVRLSAYQLELASGLNPRQSAVTFYWQAQTPPDAVWQVYVRWQGAAFSLPLAPGRHPVNDYYPTAAWQAGEVVPDFHLLDRPILPIPVSAELQVALAPPFTPGDQLAWHTVTQAELPPLTVSTAQTRQLQAGEVWLTGVTLPAQIRPNTPTPITLNGFAPAGVRPDLALNLAWSPDPPSAVSTLPLPQTSASLVPFSWQTRLISPPAAGRFELVVNQASQAAICGWLTRPRAACSLGAVSVSGVSLPPDAVNFADAIALLHLAVDSPHLTPGGGLNISLTWQALAPMAENYTVFVQVLDDQDRLVGQVDSWPMQGTYPTSQWPVGAVVEDAYRVQLSAEMPPGNYRLYLGWYLLADLHRLPVLDATGQPVADKFSLMNLSVK